MDFVEGIGKSYMERKAQQAPYQVENLVKKQFAGGEETSKPKDKARGHGKGGGSIVGSMAGGASSKDLEIARLKEQLAAYHVSRGGRAREVSDDYEDEDEDEDDKPYEGMRRVSRQGKKGGKTVHKTRSVHEHFQDAEHDDGEESDDYTHGHGPVPVHYGRSQHEQFAEVDHDDNHSHEKHATTKKSRKAGKKHRYREESTNETDEESVHGVSKHGNVIESTKSVHVHEEEHIGHGNAHESPSHEVHHATKAHDEHGAHQLEESHQSAGIHESHSANARSEKPKLKTKKSKLELLDARIEKGQISTKPKRKLKEEKKRSKSSTRHVPTPQAFDAKFENGKLSTKRRTDVLAASSDHAHGGDSRHEQTHHEVEVIHDSHDHHKAPSVVSEARSHHTTNGHHKIHDKTYISHSAPTVISEVASAHRPHSKQYTGYVATPVVLESHSHAPSVVREVTKHEEKYTSHAKAPSEVSTVRGTPVLVSAPEVPHKHSKTHAQALNEHIVRENKISGVESLERAPSIAPSESISVVSHHRAPSPVPIIYPAHRPSKSRKRHEHVPAVEPLIITSSPRKLRSEISRKQPLLLMPDPHYHPPHKSPASIRSSTSDDTYRKAPSVFSASRSQYSTLPSSVASSRYDHHRTESSVSLRESEHGGSAALLHERKKYDRRASRGIVPEIPPLERRPECTGRGFHPHRAEERRERHSDTIEVLEDPYQRAPRVKELPGRQVEILSERPGRTLYKVR